MQRQYFVSSGSFLSRVKVLSTLLVMGLLMGSSGCSSPPPEEEAGRRALERWQALIQGDLEKAYGYLSPGYREVTSFAVYRSHIGGAVRWKDTALKDVSCADTVCDVTLTIHYQYTAQPVGKYEGNKILQEKWVRVDDTWWFLPKD